jgi:hypothetical protein
MTPGADTPAPYEVMAPMAATTRTYASVMPAAGQASALFSLFL